MIERDVNRPFAYHLITFGCQMNEADSRSLAALLEAHGYRAAADPADADLILLNTCCVRPKPEQKALSRLGDLVKYKAANPDLVIGVVGCMAQKEGPALLKRARMVDLVVGPRRLARLPELAAACRSQRQAQCDVSLNGARPWLPTDTTHGGLTAFVTIIQGCSNFCSYCIVPHVRGPEASRPAEEIVAEVSALVAGGCREVTLLGQNVLAYGKDSGAAGFADLLVQLNAVPGLERIRFTTAHPRDVTDDIIAAVGELPRVCEHFHLPIQAGNDRLLAAMGRGYTAAGYLDLVGRIRARVPGVSITTDIMVGFPGETEDEFAASLDVYRQIGFDQSFTFIYSTRPGTPASDLPDQLPYRVKEERLRRAVALQSATSTEINRRRVDSTTEVLVEGVSEKDATRVAGRTRENKMVVFPGDDSLIGQLVTVRLIAAHLWGFRGERV
jgi:tRNA-2-methylthio-N6-dimethylallyladenosine synthase